MELISGGLNRAATVSETSRLGNPMRLVVTCRVGHGYACRTTTRARSSRREELPQRQEAETESHQQDRSFLPFIRCWGWNMAAAVHATVLLSPSSSSSPLASCNARRSIDPLVHKVSLAAARRPVQQSCLLGERLALTVTVELEAAKGRNIHIRAAADDAARTSAGSLPAAALTSLVGHVIGHAMRF